MRTVVSMRKLLSVSAALATAAALALTAMAPAQAVVGGTDSDVTASPWQVAVVTEGTRLCGGTLVSTTSVITAAHCITNPDRITLAMGITRLSDSSQAQFRSSPNLTVTTHPAYERESFAYDVAVISFPEPVQITSKVAPLSLPSTTGDWFSAGTPATVTGWGATRFEGENSDVLQTASVQVLQNPGDPGCGAYGTSFLEQVMLCIGTPAGGVDACQGDSGGPLVIDQAGVPTLAGVVSTGFECGLADYPGLFTRVSTVLPWLVSNIPGASLPTDPQAPADTTVQALAGNRVLVSWPAVEGPVRTATTDGASCSAPSLEGACVLEGLRPGALYTVLLDGQPFASNQAVAVDKVTPAGVKLRKRFLAQAAQVPASKVRSVVTATPSACAVKGKDLVTVSEGLCVARVKYKVGGSLKKSTVYLWIK